MRYYTSNKLLYGSSINGFRNPKIEKVFTTLYGYNNSYCIGINKLPPEILLELQTKFSTTIGKTLYFTKESKYPRFRLQGTAYKRVIKEDKADTIVLPTINQDDFNRYHYYSWANNSVSIYEDNAGVYVISKSCQDLFSSEEEMLKMLAKEGYDLKYIGSYKYLFYFTKKVFPLIDLYLGKYNKPVITDEMLNINLSQTYPTITEQDINSIDSMLQSTDMDTRELGLKMLAGFNVFATPTLIKALIYKNYNNLQTFFVRGGVEIERLLNSVDCTRGYISQFPNWLDLLIRDSKDELSDYERDQIKRLVKDIYKKVLNNQIEKMKDSLNTLNLNVKVVVE